MRKKVLYAAGIAAVVGVAVVGAGVFSGAGDVVPAYNADNLIRIHVVAHSDSEVDQSLKLRVRDAITNEMRTHLTGLTNIDAAESAVVQHLELVQKTAENEVRAAGADYPVRVVYGTFDFPTRKYGSLVVPEGKYQALRVVLGRGDGANWWCVLFPPLCFMHSEADTGDETMAARRVNAPVRVQMKLRTVELWERSADFARQAAQRFER